MIRAYVYYNRTLAGYLLKNRRRYVFLYDRNYAASKNSSIALNLPKAKRVFTSANLFPFFQGLLPEGANKKFYCRQLNINPKDKFSMLLGLAQNETIGPVTVRRER